MFFVLVRLNCRFLCISAFLFAAIPTYQFDCPNEAPWLRSVCLVGDVNDQSQSALSHEFNNLTSTASSLFNNSDSLPSSTAAKSVDFVVNLTTTNAENDDVDAGLKNNLSRKLNGDDLRAGENEPQIASFDEWTKQKLEEHQTKVADNQKNGVATSAGNVVPHMAARNYASKECGAKVLLANPEAQNAGAVLNEKELDEYMLNPCNTEGQKWFVVELCETIQITKIEIANFELFSSRPKDFKVWSSERYPSPEWTLVGDWTAQDKRELQSFEVKSRHYAKYLKVELLSHYGTEHFCPLSLLRVVGISMVEEYELEAGLTPDSQQPSQPADAQTTDVPQNVTAIPSSMNTSTASVNASTASPPTESSPPKSDYLETAKKAVVSIAREMFDKAQLVFVRSKPTPPTDPPTDTVDHVPPTLAPMVNKSTCTPNTTVKGNTGETVSPITWSVCKVCRQNVSWLAVPKFCGYYLLLTTPPPPLVIYLPSHPSRDDQKPIETSEPFDDYDSEMPTPSEFFIDEEESMETLAPPTTEQTPLTPPPSLTLDNSNNLTRNETTGNHSINKLNETSKDFVLTPPAHTTLPGVAMSTKESVFVRLNNRIKMLELNISLSSQYLSELSKKYRKQMEDIQRAFNKTSQLFNETDSKFEESLQKQAKDLTVLKEELAEMRPLMSTLAQEYVVLQKEAFQWIAVFVLFEVIVLVSLLWCCFGRRARPARLDSQQDVNILIEQAVARQLEILLRRNNNCNDKVEEYLQKQESYETGSSHVDLEPSQNNLNKKKKAKKKQPHFKIRKSSDQTFRIKTEPIQDETRLQAKSVDCLTDDILFSQDENVNKQDWTKVSTLKPKPTVSRSSLGLERQKSNNSGKFEPENQRKSSSCLINLLKLTNPFDVLKSPHKRYSMDAANNSRAFS